MTHANLRPKLRQGFNNKVQKYIVAIEGGGSHCRAVLYSTAKRAVISRAEIKQPANIASSKDTTLHVIEQTVMKFAADVSEDTDRFSKSARLVMCLPGISNTQNVAWLKKELNWPTTPLITSDVMANYFGLHDTLQDGSGIFVGGTGSIAVGYTRDIGMIRLGGRGDNRDTCCGHAIGLRALQSAQMRRNPDFITACETVARANGLDALVPGKSPVFAISQLAPHVFKLAEQDKLPAAQKIIREAAIGGAESLKRLSGLGIKKVGVVGSVAQRLLPAMTTLLRRDKTPVTLFPATESTLKNGALNVALSLQKNPRLLNTINNMRPFDDMSAQPQRRLATTP